MCPNVTYVVNHLLSQNTERNIREEAINFSVFYQHAFLKINRALSLQKDVTINLHPFKSWIRERN